MKERQTRYLEVNENENPVCQNLTVKSVQKKKKQGFLKTSELGTEEARKSKSNQELNKDSRNKFMKLPTHQRKNKEDDSSYDLQQYAKLLSNLDEIEKYVGKTQNIR